MSQLDNIRRRVGQHDGLSASQRREVRANAARVAWAATARALVAAAGGTVTLKESEIVAGQEPTVTRNGDGTVTLGVKA